MNARLCANDHKYRVRGDGGVIRACPQEMRNMQQQARKPRRFRFITSTRLRILAFFAVFGPGFITANVDNQQVMQDIRIMTDNVDTTYIKLLAFFDIHIE